MALSIKIVWDKPRNLGPKAKFHVKLLELLPELSDEPGIYVFARKHGSTVTPLYIGQASNGFKVRLKQQSNNMKLMNAIENDLSGDRVLLLGTVKVGKNHKLKSVLDIAEQAHIEHSLSEGVDLINIKGTKTKKHQISMVGPKSKSNPFPKLMYLASK